MTKLTRGGKIVVAIVIGLILGGATALIVSLVGGGTPNATAVIKSDGYTPHNLNVQNTDPADVSSEAYGTQGQVPFGNAEVVIVLTPQGQHKAQTVENEFNSLGTGLSVSVNGSVLRIQGPDSTFASLGSMGGF